MTDPRSWTHEEAYAQVKADYADRDLGVGDQRLRMLDLLAKERLAALKHIEGSFQAHEELIEIKMWKKIWNELTGPQVTLIRTVLVSLILAAAVLVGVVVGDIELIRAAVQCV